MNIYRLDDGDTCLWVAADTITEAVVKVIEEQGNLENFEDGLEITIIEPEEFYDILQKTEDGKDITFAELINALDENSSAILAHGE